jgi:hypothetical protein
MTLPEDLVPLAGGEPPAEDVPTAAIETVDEETSEALSCTMFVADFTTQFSKALGVKPVMYQELNAAICAPRVLDGRDVLWDLYEGLMRFLLNVRSSSLLLIYL